MKVKVKKIFDEAQIPKYAHSTDAGMDLYAISRTCDDDNNLVYGTGLAFEIPEGYVGLLFPRSSNAKKDLLMSNSVGVIDSGYRGEVKIKYKMLPTINCHRTFQHYELGERIGQLIILPYPKIEFEEVDELSETDRGEGGYGSTGK